MTSTTATKTTATADIAEMMSAWNTIEAAARKANPSGSAEDIYAMTAAAMRKTLGL